MQLVYKLCEQGKHRFLLDAHPALLVPNGWEVYTALEISNVHYFYVGGYGGFDQIAATAVKRANQKHPDITLMLALPYYPAERPIKKPPGYDGTYYPERLEKTPRPFAVVKANLEYGDDTELNTDAIGMVIDFAQIQNRRECKVNEYDAFQCEIDDRSYLCWTITPEISCVIEYCTDEVEDADIFRMAGSVLLPFD